MHGKISLETDRILSVMKAKTFDAPMTSSGTRSEEVVLIKPLGSSFSPRPNQMNHRPLDKPSHFPVAANPMCYRGWTRGNWSVTLEDRQFLTFGIPWMCVMTLC